jgi:hypothetical protein
LWTDAIYGFDNEAWSADEVYLAMLASEASRIAGSILECGSGLSTIVLAAVAERTGARIHALEQSREWKERMTRELDALSLTQATVHFAPLKLFRDDEMEYEWYDTSGLPLPASFQLVVSDGPAFAKHNHAFGGRYGMLPQMGSRLAAHCCILADDANDVNHRPGMEQWAKELSTELQLTDSVKGAGRIVVPARER